MKTQHFVPTYLPKMQSSITKYCADTKSDIDCTCHEKSVLPFFSELLLYYTTLATSATAAPVSTATAATATPPIVTTATATGQGFEYKNFDD